MREAIPKLLSGAQKQILQRYIGLYGGSPSHHGFLGGGLEHEFYDFPYIGNVIIPTDELHHFSEGYVNQVSILSLCMSLSILSLCLKLV